MVMYCYYYKRFFPQKRWLQKLSTFGEYLISSLETIFLNLYDIYNQLHVHIIFNIWILLISKHLSYNLAKNILDSWMYYIDYIAMFSNC